METSKRLAYKVANVEMVDAQSQEHQGRMVGVYVNRAQYYPCIQRKLMKGNLTTNQTTSANMSNECSRGICLGPDVG